MIPLFSTSVQAPCQATIFNVYTHYDSTREKLKNNNASYKPNESKLSSHAVEVLGTSLNPESGGKSKSFATSCLLLADLDNTNANTKYIQGKLNGLSNGFDTTYVDIAKNNGGLMSADTVRHHYKKFVYDGLINIVKYRNYGLKRNMLHITINRDRWVELGLTRRRLLNSAMDNPRGLQSIQKIIDHINSRKKQTAQQNNVAVCTIGTLNIENIIVKAEPNYDFFTKDLSKRELNLLYSSDMTIIDELKKKGAISIDQYMKLVLPKSFIIAEISNKFFCDKGEALQMFNRLYGHHAAKETHAMPGNWLKVILKGIQGEWDKFGPPNDRPERPRKESGEVKVSLGYVISAGQNPVGDRILTEDQILIHERAKETLKERDKWDDPQWRRENGLPVWEPRETT